MYLGAVGNRCRNKNDMAENLAGPEALPPRIRSITHQIDPLRRVFYCSYLSGFSEDAQL